MVGVLRGLHAHRHRHLRAEVNGQPVSTGQGADYQPGTVPAEAVEQSVRRPAEAGPRADRGGPGRHPDAAGDAAEARPRPARHHPHRRPGGPAVQPVARGAVARPPPTTPRRPRRCPRRATPTAAAPPVATAQPATAPYAQVASPAPPRRPTRTTPPTRCSGCAARPRAWSPTWRPASRSRRRRRSARSRPSSWSTTASSSTTTCCAAAAARSRSRTSSASRWSRRWRDMPAMNAGYTLEDGKPARRHPGARQPRPRDRPGQAGRHPSAARAEHQERRHDGLRPVLGRVRGRRPPRPRQQAHRRRTSPGTTISLTNPGTIGTVHSVPRLMAGPGHDHRRRRDGLPGRVRRDVRGAPQPDGHLQGAHADVDLRPPDHPGRAVRRLPADRRAASCSAQDGFYDRVFAALRVPVRAGPLGPRHRPTPTTTSDKPGRIAELIHSYRSRGHLMADTDPLAYRQRKHPDLDVQTHGLTLWDLDRTFPTGGFGGKHRMKLRDVLGLLRDSYCRTIGIEYMHLAGPASSARWLQERLEPGTPARRARTSCASCAASTPPRRSRPSCRPSTSARSGSRSRAASRSSRCSTRSCPGPPTTGSTRSASAWPTAAGSTCWRTSPARATAQIFSEFEGNQDPKSRAGLGRREVPPRHRGHVHRRVRRDDQGLPRGQPVAPRGGRPGARGHRARQAGPHRPRRRRLLRAADPHPRRRGVRGPGRGHRDAQPLAAARVPHRRHHPRHHQQPGRLHHRPVARRARRCTRPTSPRACRCRSSTSTGTTPRRACGWPSSRSTTASSSTATSSSTWSATAAAVTTRATTRR